MHCNDPLHDVGMKQAPTAQNRIPWARPEAGSAVRRIKPIAKNNGLPKLSTSHNEKSATYPEIHKIYLFN
jgi:hypothetical protein